MPFSGEIRPTKRMRSRPGRIGAGHVIGGEKCVDVRAVEHHVRLFSVIGKRGQELPLNVVAAADYGVSLLDPARDHRAVVLRQPFAVHMQDDASLRIEGTNDWNELREIVNVDDLALPSARLPCRLKDIGEVMKGRGIFRPTEAMLGVGGYSDQFCGPAMQGVADAVERLRDIDVGGALVLQRARTKILGAELDQQQRAAVGEEAGDLVRPD